MSLPVVDLGISYDAEKDRISDFLSNFKGDKSVTSSFANLDLNQDDEQDTISDTYVGLKYMRQLQAIANRDQLSLDIELEDIYEHEKTLGELVTRIIGNTRRYANLFCEVVDKLLPPATKDISDKDEVIDVILHQRRERNLSMEGGSDIPFPDHLLRR
jgi:DNA replication licensing factor MCM7